MLHLPKFTKIYVVFWEHFQLLTILYKFHLLQYKINAYVGKIQNNFAQKYITLMNVTKNLCHAIIITIKSTDNMWIKMKITDTENITENICINKSRNLKMNQLEDTTISNLRLAIFTCYITTLFLDCLSLDYCVKDW